MILQILCWQVHRGMVEAALELLNSSDLHRLIRTSKGWIASYTAQSKEDPSELLTVTLWQSVDDMQVFLESSGFIYLTNQLKDLLEREVESSTYQARIEY